MSLLFLSNVPWNCEESDVQQWIGMDGIHANSVPMVWDRAADARSTAEHVTLRDSFFCRNSILVLNGPKLKDRS